MKPQGGTLDKMMVTTTKAQQQKPKRKFQSCRNNCGVSICFDPKIGRTPSGGWIQMQEDSIGQLVKHECPNKQPKQTKQQQQQQQSEQPQRQADSSSAIIEKEISQLRAELSLLRTYLLAAR